MEGNPILMYLRQEQMRRSPWSVLVIGLTLYTSGLAWPRVVDGMPRSQPAAPPLATCLPKGIGMTTVVSATALPGTANTVKTVTVADRLRQLKATCRHRTPVDRSGRAIRFYRLEGCWGNPPMNYREILQQQTATIRQLQKTFTVIELTCNPSGIPYP